MPDIDIAKESSVQEVDDKVGSTTDTGGSSTAGSMMGKINNLLSNWTSTRAGYLDNIKTNVDNINTNTDKSTTEDKSGTLSQKMNYIISSLLGSTDDTGGSVSAGSVMGKLNAILKSVTSSSGAVKSVQRGVVKETEVSTNDSEYSSGGNTGYYTDIKISTINPNKAIVLLNTTNQVRVGDDRNYSYSVSGRIINSTTLRVYCTNVSSGRKYVSSLAWQVIEFY